MAKQRVLIVDDEEDILELVRYNLSKEGYKVTLASSGEEAMSQIKTEQPDLIVLDLMLPGMDGLEVCRKLKGSTDTRDIPIIMLSAKSEDADVITGLEIGADDYVVKPFSPKVLIARIRKIFGRKRVNLELDSLIKIHQISINPGRHEVLVNGKQVELSYTEFGVLQTLAKKPGWVFSRYQIVDAIRGSDYPVTERSVDVQIVGLRKKLGDHGRYIETVRGVGYRLAE